MNYYGSYKKLLGNAKAAMMSAIELYNKPTFFYREECVAILLVNAWELLLKAVLCKRGEKIYYPKKKKEERRSLSLQDSVHRVRMLPESKFPPAWESNIKIVQKFRDSATHLYNKKHMPATLYPFFRRLSKIFAI